MTAALSIVRLAFHFLVPVAGCVLIQFNGGTYGPWTAVGMSIGLFVYAYLQWGFVATESSSPEKKHNGVWILISVVLVGLLVRGNWKDWIIEQTLLEAVAFGVGLAILVLYKAGKEQASKSKPPWLLLLLIFILPVVLLIWKILPVWIDRYSDGSFPEWALFGAAFLFSAWAAFSSMKPFAIGDDTMSEPLDRSWKLVFMVIWLLVLFTVLITFSDK